MKIAISLGFYILFLIANIEGRFLLVNVGNTDVDDDYEAEVLFNGMTIFNSEVTAIYHGTSFVQTFSFENETWVDAVDVTDEFSLGLK